ncbi:MAG: hypothetical protein ACLPID_06245 [Beijerinckiaceae bacterium]
MSEEFPKPETQNTREVIRAVEADEDVVGTSKFRDLESKLRELERLLGRKTLEIEILLARLLRSQ